MYKVRKLKSLLMHILYHQWCYDKCAWWVNGDSLDHTLVYTAAFEELWDKKHTPGRFINNGFNTVPSCFQQIFNAETQNCFFKRTKSMMLQGKGPRDVTQGTTKVWMGLIIKLASYVQHFQGKTVAKARCLKVLDSII